MGLNSIINNRIGLGSFQIRTFLILCLIDLNDGVQLVLSSFLNPIIKAIYPEVSTSYISAIASVFYIGILFGSIISGHLADKFGRKTIIIYGAIMQLVTAVLFFMADSLLLMFVLRLLYGFSFGFTIAVTTSMFAQVTPQAYRGKGILLINFCMSIGKLYAVALGYIFIKNNLAETNWKLLMICGSIPNIIVLIGSQFVLTESPRFLLAHKRFEQGVSVINQMIRTNKGDQQPILSPQEEEQVKYQFSIEDHPDSHLSISALFQGQNLKYILSLSLCWIILNFCYYGQLTVEALHISGPKISLKEGLEKYFFTVFGEMPSLALSLYMIDHPLFGRKNSLIVFFAASGVFHLLFGLTALTVVGSIARFFMKDVFQVIYPLTTESFETKIRAKGFGFCSGIGRIGSVLMPFILIPLDEWNQSSVYLCFFVISMIACYIAWAELSETMNRNLDRIQEGQMLQELASNDCD